MSSKMRTALVFILGTAALWTGPAAFAQRLFGPNAADIFQQAREAIRKVSVVSYEAGYNLDGKHPELLPGGEGKVIIRSGGPKGRNQVWIDGHFWFRKLKEPRHLTVSTDGNAGYQIQYDTKNFYKSDYTLVEDLIYPGEVLILKAFGSDEPYGYDVDPQNAVYQGEIDVDDVECHILQLFHERFGGETYLYVGKEDLLPRRLDRTFKFGEETVTSSLSLFNLDTSPTLANDQFRLLPPDGYGQEDYVGKPRLLEVGTRAPDFTVKHGAGGSVTLSALRGRVVVLDFWATWCGPCKRAMPSVQKLHDRFAGEPVNVYGVSTFETTGDPIGYMKKKGYTYELLVEGDRAAEDYHITGIPTFYVIGPKGDIIYVQEGYHAGEEDKLVEIVEEALAEYRRSVEKNSY